MEKYNPQKHEWGTDAAAARARKMTPGQKGINEVLTKSDSIEKWIKDFITSDDERFEGKSKKERIEMAKGAYYDAQNESAEQAETKSFFSLRESARSADRKPQNYKDPVTGRTKVRMVPVDKEIIKMEEKDPCWDNYEQVGMKKKNGKEVPNCVPKEEVEQMDLPKPELDALRKGTNASEGASPMIKDPEKRVFNDKNSAFSYKAKHGGKVQKRIYTDSKTGRQSVSYQVVKEALDEALDKMSDARLKYHAEKDFPHGSYTTKEIKREHERRRRVVPNYHKVKPVLEDTEEALDEKQKLTTLNKLMWKANKSQQVGSEKGASGPAAMKTKTRQHDTKTLKSLQSKDPKSTQGKSPAAFQQRLVKHELKRRGVSEDVSLEEALDKMSDARLKYHAEKEFPHGSYTNKEIKREHERRRKVVPNYHKVKPVLEEAESSELNEMAENHLHFVVYAAEEILEFLETKPELEDWYLSKLSKIHGEMEGLYSYAEGEMRRDGVKEGKLPESKDGVLIPLGFDENNNVVPKSQGMSLWDIRNR